MPRHFMSQLNCSIHKVLSSRLRFFDFIYFLILFLFIAGFVFFAVHGTEIQQGCTV